MSRSCTSIEILATSAMLIALMTAGTSCSHEVSSKPASVDIILVTLDTTRADALGCYGAAGKTSPTLDALAHEGVVFERCVTSSAITPVSHASILTGLLPHQHGLRFFSGRSGYRLSPKIATLATVLHERSYTTAAVHSAFPVSSAFGFETGFESGFVHDLERDEAKRVVKPEDYQRPSNITIDLALEVLESTSGPLFLWVHLFDAHDAKLRPPQEFLP